MDNELKVIQPWKQVGTHPRRVTRNRLSEAMLTSARITLGFTIIFTPFRYRYVLSARTLPPIYQDYTDFLIFPSDVFLIATLILWSLSLVLRSTVPRMAPAVLTLTLGGVTIFSATSAFFSVDPPLTIYHVVRLVILFWFYLYVIHEVQSLDQIILPLSLQVFIQAVVGIGQVWKQNSLGLQSLGELMLNPESSGVSIVWAAGIRSLRAYGLSDHPNILGGSFAFALILMAGWITDKVVAKKTILTAWLMPAVSLFALGVLGLLLTYSRAAWIAYFGGLSLIFLLLWRTRQTRALTFWMGLIGASLIFISPFVLQSLGFIGVRLNIQNSFTSVEVEKRSLTERAALYQAANELFADHALTGVGLGSFPIALQQRFPDFVYDYQPVHNVLLDVAAEVGLFGALLFSLLIVWPGLALWVNRKKIHFSIPLLAASGALLTVTIVGFFDYYPWLLAPGRLWQWFILGLWGSQYRRAFEKDQNG